MAKVEYADMIKTVSGALTKINKKSQHAHDQKMVLSTHRVAATTSKDCSRIFLRGFSSVTRTAPVKQTEIEARSRFAAVSAMVKTRSKDLTKITADQAAFEAQKNSAYGKKTMLAWYWKVCGDQYDETLNG